MQGDTEGWGLMQFSKGQPAELDPWEIAWQGYRTVWTLEPARRGVSPGCVTYKLWSWAHYFTSLRLSFTTENMDHDGSTHLEGRSET